MDALNVLLRYLVKFIIHYNVTR